MKRVEHIRMIRMSPRLAQLKMVEGGRYKVENWTIVCMGATCTLTKMATICPQTL
jgi:hypothetical protein